MMCGAIERGTPLTVDDLIAAQDLGPLAPGAS